MAILTFIKFPTDSIITKEQLEGVSSINENKLMEIFKRTFVSGVMADGITSDVFKPTYISNVGTVVNFSISPGVGIIGSGYMVILESALETSTDFSVNGNKTLFIKFNQDWSDDITTIQKPTGNIIEVSKVQLQDSNILEWSDYDPTGFDPNVPGNNFPIGKLVYEDSAYKFKYDEGYRHIYIPNTRFPDKSYNISPSVDTFCSLFELLSCRGGGLRTTANPFGLSTRDVKNLLESFLSFIDTPGIVDVEANQLLVSGTGSNIMKIYTGKAISASGKYMENTSIYEESTVAWADDDYYIYIHAIKDSDGYDTFEFVKSTSTLSGDDYLVLAKVSILVGNITAITDLRTQLLLIATAVGYNPPAPPKHPGIYVLEKNLNPYTDLYDVVAQYGDKFYGDWVGSDLFEMTPDHGWVDGVWNEPAPIENVGPWYLHVVSAGLDTRYKILEGKTLSGSGKYTFTLDGNCGYGSFPVTGAGQIITEADCAIIGSTKNGEEIYTGHPAIFEEGWSYEPINIVGLKPDTDYDLNIKAFKDGIPSIISDAITESITAGFKLAGCKVYSDFRQTVVHDHTDHLIEFNKKVEDVCSDFNTTTHEFTASQAGTYIVTLQIMTIIGTSTTDNPRTYKIKKNGISISQNGCRGATRFLTETQTIRVILGEGDVITFTARVDNVAAGDIELLDDSAKHYACVTQICK